MTEEITAETEVSKAAMIARQYLDGDEVYLYDAIPHLVNAIVLIFDSRGVETQFFWRSPLGRQLSTVKEAIDRCQEVEAR